MSEHTYRLDLTERERVDLIDTIGWQLRHAFPRIDVQERLTVMLETLAALQPIGTDGKG